MCVCVEGVCGGENEQEIKCVSVREGERDGGQEGNISCSWGEMEERERIASSSLHPLFVATSMHHCHFHYTDVTFLHTNNVSMGFPNPLYRVE